MYQTPPGTTPSYRLGDHANATITDGDYIARITGLEPSLTKEQKPQLKVSSVLIGGAANGKTHTWWYNLGENSLWRFFNDLIKAGVDQNFDPGPPGPNYAQVFSPALVNRAFQIRVATKSDFQNTTINAVANLGPDGMPVQAPAMAAPAPQGAFAAAPVPQGQSAAGNQPTAYHPAGAGPPPNMSFGNAPPMNPGGAPVTQAPPVNYGGNPDPAYGQQSPTGYVNVSGVQVPDPSSLFRAQ